MKINRIASGLLLTVALAVVSCGTERSDGGKLAKETEAVGLRCRNLIDPEGGDKASLPKGSFSSRASSTGGASVFGTRPTR